MLRLLGCALASVVALLLGSATSSAQPPAVAVQPPEPMPMGWSSRGAFVPYPGMPIYSWAQWRGMAPPPPQPLTYPFTGYVAGYPYPGYTMRSPYPRTVSSYSSGPSLYPPVGRVGGWRR
jgi:hypothetical protein